MYVMLFNETSYVFKRHSHLGMVLSCVFYTSYENKGGPR